MKFYALLIFLSCFWGGAVLAQKAEWSAEEKLTDHNIDARILGQNREGLFVLRQSERLPAHDITIERYSDNMHKVATEEFLVKKGEFLVQAILQENELQLYYGTSNKETKNIDVWVKRLDASLASIGKDTLVFSVPEDNIRYEFLMVYKPNQFPLTICIYPTDNYQNPAALHYILMNGDLSMAGSGDFNVSMESKYTVSQLMFTQNEILMVADMNIKHHGEEIPAHYLLSGALGDNSLKKIPLFDDSIMVGEGIIRADYKNNDLVYTGLYKLQDSGYAKGYYVWIKDIAAGKTNMYKIPFPTKLLEDVVGRNAKVKGIYNLIANDLVMRQDGGFILTAEQQETSREVVNEINVYGISQANYETYYYYKSLIALSVNKEGKTDWYKVLRKEQQTINDNGVYSSYITGAMPGKMMYLYNDLSRKNWSLAGFELEPDGTAQNEIVVKSNDYTAQLVPMSATQVSENQVVIPGFGRKGAVLLKISF